MKKSILLTQWINLALLFICFWIAYIIDGWDKDNLILLILKAPIAIVIYSVFWVPIIIVPYLLFMLGIDLLFMRHFKNSSNIRNILLTEWVIYSIPLVIAAILYEKPRIVFIAIMLILLIGQLLRAKPINKIVEKYIV